MLVDTVDNPFCAINDEGVRLRKQVADGVELEWEGCVPMEVIPFFRLGTRKINTALYGNMFSEPINFNEFRAYISGKRKNKAPGMSGIRIDHICGLHEQGQKDINLPLGGELLPQRNHMLFSQIVFSAHRVCTTV